MDALLLPDVSPTQLLSTNSGYAIDVILVIHPPPPAVSRSVGALRY